MAADVVLNSQGGRSQRNVLHQGDGPVGAHLGYGDGGGLVAVHAGVAVNWEAIMLATFGKNLGGGRSICNGRLDHVRGCS